MPGWRGPFLFPLSQKALPMIDHTYLQKGLLATARSHQAGSMAGHLGASVLAGYYLGEDYPDLPKAVIEGIQGELQRIIQGEEALWTSIGKTGIGARELFAAAGDIEFLGSPQGDPEDMVLALSHHGQHLKQSGHNTIFAALALRALKDHPELATQKIIQGLKRLMQQFDQAAPGRGYFGKAQGWLTGNQIKLDASQKRTPFISMDQAIQEVMELFAREVIHRRRGFGGWFHLINHTAALQSLHHMGWESQCQLGLKTLQRHLEYYLALPDLTDELGSLQRASVDPRQSAYWQGSHRQSSQWSGWLTHRIKTMHGFYQLRESLDEDRLRQACDHAFLYLMA